MPVSYSEYRVIIMQARKTRTFRRDKLLYGSDGSALRVVAVCFLLGVVLGSFIGAHSVADEAVAVVNSHLVSIIGEPDFADGAATWYRDGTQREPGDSAGTDVPEDYTTHDVSAGTAKGRSSSAALALWDCGKYHLLLVLFAASTFGVLSIPILAAVRGYLLSCTAAAIFVAYPETGIPLGFALVGIPALCTVPSFMLLAVDGLAMARGIRERRRFGLTASSARERRGRELPRNLFICVLSLCLSITLERLLTPALVSLILRA